MPVQSVSMNNTAFRGEVAKKDETLALNTEKRTDNNRVDKKKLALALGGLAVAGIAAVAIAKSGKKVPSEMGIEEFKKIGKFDKGVARAKGKLFTGTIDVPAKDGKYIIEYEKGILKQSTFFKKVVFPEHVNMEPQLMPVSKKVYLKEDGAKIVECWLKNNQAAVFGGEEWARIGRLNIAEDKSKVTMERINGYTGDVLKTITSRQEDGSWLKTAQEVSFDKNIVKRGNSYHILTRNVETGEILENKGVKVKPATAPVSSVSNPKTKEMFKL